MLVAVYYDWNERVELIGCYADETELLADLMDRGAEKFDVNEYMRKLDRLRQDGKMSITYDEGDYGQRIFVFREGIYGKIDA